MKLWLKFWVNIFKLLSILEMGRAGPSLNNGKLNIGTHADYLHPKP